MRLAPPKRGTRAAAKTRVAAALRPPDLIIQDELHLISGPLGSLVGLYETAVDELCTWEVEGRRVRPKVIASTATIRQAADQVSSLFKRRVAIFPPQCIDVEDNFFSRQRTAGEANPGRLYLGVCAPGRRLKAALIRVYLAEMAAAQSLFEKYGAVADPWMTLVGYFNSLRELGGMRRMVEDDVATRLKRMSVRGLSNRYLNDVKELTSRMSSTEIPKTLEQMEKTFGTDMGSGTGSGTGRPIDVLLATNMISVGVDVPRLSAMVVAGQPKATSEYIQATSRVGRRHPGLVVTVFNWARPRDLSHFETFENYHARFYERVEAISLTPFSSGAIDRGLAALLVSLVRLRGQEFNANEAARTVKRDHEVVRRAKDAILARAETLGGTPMRDSIERRLATKLDHWMAVAKSAPGAAELVYKQERGEHTKGLLKDPVSGASDEFACLHSLRNVEPMSRLVMSDRALDYAPEREPQPFEGSPVVEAEDEET